MQNQQRLWVVVAFVTVASASVFLRPNVELIETANSSQIPEKPELSLAAQARLDEIPRLAADIPEIDVDELADRASSDPDAAYTLASYYWEQPNYEARAFRYMLTAAISNHPQAAGDLALMYARGIGAKRDDLRARAWIEIAKQRDAPVPMTAEDLGLSELVAEENEGLASMVQAITARAT